MAKLGILVAYEDILDIFNEVLKDSEAEIVCKKVVATENIIQEARNAVYAGAEIIIARGYQAKMIQLTASVPVVEIRLHTQEIGIMVRRAQKLLGKEKIRVGLITYKNMLSDITYIGELFDVELQVGLIEYDEDIALRIDDMRKTGVDIFFGGAKVKEYADEIGYPSLIYKSSYESVREALRQADTIGRAMRMKEDTQLQINSFMDTTFNGFIRIGTDAKVISGNKLVSEMVHKNIEKIIGAYIWNLFPELEEKIISKILSGKSDIYVTSISVNDQAWMAMISSVKLKDEIVGAVISFQNNTNQIARTLQKQMFVNGYIANTHFKDLDFISPAMKSELALARKYAISDAPIIMECKDNDEYYMIAEAIHNNSNRKNYPFVSCNVRSILPEKQMIEFFGSEEVKGSRDVSIIHRANNGTLLIKDFEYIRPEVQYQLMRMLMRKSVIRTDTDDPYIYNIRIIAVISDNFYMLMENGQVVSDLFYMINGLNLRIPPLSERPEDLVRYFKDEFKNVARRYSKYLVLTSGAINAVTQFSWPGNVFQIKAFCERLVMGTEKRNIDEVQITKLYYELFPTVKNEDGQKKIVVYKSAEADQLSECLRKHHGNRVKVAEELGISTTTLWRHMKKYGIEADYNGS